MVFSFLRLVSRLVRCWPKTTTDHQLYDHLDLGGGNLSAIEFLIEDVVILFCKGEGV